MQRNDSQLQREESQMDGTKSQIERKESKKESTVGRSIPLVKSNMFKFGGFCFKDMENSLVKCGVCDTECKRLIHHLNKCSECNRYIDMEKFKNEYDKYKLKQRIKKLKLRQRHEDLNKHESCIAA